MHTESISDCSSGWTGTALHPQLAITPALIGNGMITLRLTGPGYSARNPQDWAEFLAWAARRQGGPFHHLIRFGRFYREIFIDNADGTDCPFNPAIDYRHGILHAECQHDGVREKTETFIHLEKNVLLASTTLTNERGSPARVRFTVTYAPGDPFGNCSNMEVHRPGHDSQLVEIRTTTTIAGVMLRADWGEWRNVADHNKAVEAEFILAPGESRTLRTWLTLSDALEYTHPPKLHELEDFIQRHRRAWEAFWETGWVDFDNPELLLLWRSSMYAIRCNTTRWSVPPCVGAYWDGRTFHDEYYPFMALVSSGHYELAERIPEFRLRVLPRAIERSAGRGAQYPWESTELGLDGTPFGGHMDEHFHMGQISETAFQWAIHSPKMETWNRLYPLWAECAEYFRLNLIVEESGNITTRACTDYDEGVYPIANGIYTSSSAICCFRNAIEAANRLGVERERAQEWRRLMEGLLKSLPRSVDNSRYATGLSDHLHIAVVGPVHPFRADVRSDAARRSLDEYRERCRTVFNWTPGTLPGYDDSHWMWSAAHLAGAYAAQNRGDEAYEVLKRAPSSAGPFHSPNESRRSRIFTCPWFTTGAGAVVHAINAMFIRAEADHTVLFPAVPKELDTFSFRLAGHGGVIVSCEVKGRKVARLDFQGRDERTWNVEYGSGLKP